MAVREEMIIKEYLEYICNNNFPCVAAKAAVAKHQVRCMVAGNMACPNDDSAILNFLYAFVDAYRLAASPFHSAVILFDGMIHSEEQYDQLLWQRLQSLADLDAANYKYDQRVDKDPASAEFSFSLKEEAFFIIGLHPLNNRPGRRFSYPAIVFNPHAEFVRMRKSGGYEKMKVIVRKRDLATAGSINSMLDDFGNASETFQYSGKQYEPSWQCPLKINHGTNDHNPTP